MKLIEIHILQSYPVSCLNRDDVGSPKSAIFGGVRRARISSQCQKRAHRLNFNERQFGNPTHSERTRLAHEALAKKMISLDVPKDIAKEVSIEVLSKLLDKKGMNAAKEDDAGRLYLPALIWLSPAQLANAAIKTAGNMELLLEIFGKANPAGEKLSEKEKKAAEKKRKILLGAIVDAIKEAGVADAPDIAFFGRMVANEASLNIEGATMYAHA
ncbi:MAG: type I-E CRISPR-associated protein Cas7/Cse4/CasC, partial [Symploca sp. SIO2E6]|nr:type I-E CRISPR-associated protein Cas7/Cse4/CasC [Symploca sp. SIO2E6]